MDPISLNVVELQSPATTVSKKIDAATIKPATDGANGQNAANEANSYNKFDTMELSREYVGYRTKSENATVNSDTQQLNSTVDQKPTRISGDEDDESSKKKETKPQNTEEEKEDESISNSQLAGYTSSELKGLVLSGKITIATYNAEMKSRQDDAPKPVEQNIPKAQNPQSNQKIVVGLLNRRAANTIL